MFFAIGLWYHNSFLITQISDLYGMGMGKENLVYPFDASTILTILLGLLSVFQLLDLLKVNHWQ